MLFVEKFHASEPVSAYLGFKNSLPFGQALVSGWRDLNIFSLTTRPNEKLPDV